MFQTLITVSEAAQHAGRSRTVIHRWIKEGLVVVIYKAPGLHGTQFIDRATFLADLPKILEEMDSRKGGQPAHKTKGIPHEATVVQLSTDLDGV